jgi:RNA polymerase sigma-70 factor (ECF subfamily)
MQDPTAERLLKHFVEEDVVLRAYVMAATRSPHETDDVLQNIWRVLWEKIAQYDDTRPVRAWAFGVARLEVLKWRQRQARSREYLTPDALDLLGQTAIAHASDLDLRAEFLKECLRTLSGLWRRVLTLKYYGDLSIRDIAERLGKSIAAVEMILVRARRALRECIDAKLREAGAGV